MTHLSEMLFLLLDYAESLLQDPTYNIYAVVVSLSQVNLHSRFRVSKIAGSG